MSSPMRRRRFTGRLSSE